MIGPDRPRTIGIARAEARLTLANLAYTSTA
jgi:hypothetical protein